MSDAHSVRWATALDDPALRRLCVRTPMHGPVSYCLEREPEFLALTRLQGDGGGRVAVVDHDGDIIAMAMMAPFSAWIGGAKQRCAYVGDLKVDPAHRRKGLAGRVVSFLGRELEREGIDRLFFLALAGNPAMDLIDDSPGHFTVRKLRTIRNHLVPFGAAKQSRSSSVVSRATAESIPEMIAFWNRNQRTRIFAPVLDEETMARWAARLGGMGAFRLVHRDGRLRGFCAAWDAAGIKQIRLLRLSGRMRLAVAMYNAIATVRGRSRFPPSGSCLRFLYVSHICAESAADLEALLVDLHDEKRTAGYLYFDLALDRDDPLAASLSRFRSMAVDFEIREARMGAQGQDEVVSGGDCAFFDVSLV